MSGPGSGEIEIILCFLPFFVRKDKISHPVRFCVDITTLISCRVKGGKLKIGSNSRSKSCSALMHVVCESHIWEVGSSYQLPYWVGLADGLLLEWQWP